MGKLLQDSAHPKIKFLHQIEKILEEKRAAGKKIAQCHGVFDLLHPGHIRHFREAKSLADLLIVSVTSDRFVNKGPDRPVFSEALRMESLAALEDIDYVVLSDFPDAIYCLQKIRPDFYVKGSEYKNTQNDLTGKIEQEQEVVEKEGGRIYYTNDLVFSSSALLNRYFGSFSPEVISFLNQVKRSFSADEIIENLDALSDLKVLIVGDAIIDEYQFVECLGQSGKGLQMVSRCLEKELFLGGSLIIANHIAPFVKKATLVTAVGQACPYRPFITQQLDGRVQPEFTMFPEGGTLVKKRYVLKETDSFLKLFETYSGVEKTLEPNQTRKITEFLTQNASEYDLIVVCDFGNGFTNPQLRETLSSLSPFLALNAQINSGNRGYNVVTNYPRADYISLNEPELRLAMHDRVSSLKELAFTICKKMQTSSLSVTRGILGTHCYFDENKHIQAPALASKQIDRVGAGDSYFALSSLCMAKKFPPLLSTFIGSLAAAMSVAVVGNQESVKKESLYKFVTHLLK